MTTFPDDDDFLADLRDSFNEPITTEGDYGRLASLRFCVCAKVLAASAART
jgi:hypothetical protein